MMFDDRLVEVRLEAQVAIGDDADDALALDDRQSGDPVLLGQREHLRAPTSTAGS